MIRVSAQQRLGILAVAAIFLLSLMAVCAAAQEVGGSISGRVLDRTGASVAGVEVIAIHLDTGGKRSTVTGQDGIYAFPDLPIGAYELSASRPGFRQALKKGIELHVSDRLGVDLTLEVGELAQEVSVTDAVEQVQTESAEQGSLISGEQVRELQLNGRSFMTLLELAPGVASNMGDRMDPNSSPSVSINGARSTASNFNIDGGNNSDVIVGSSALNTFTSVESIAEFTVLTSTFSAEYGRAGFSQVNVVTKGGTKKFHGSLYEFFRNDAMDARDYFSHQVLPLRLNNFGYTLGGPAPLPYNRRRDRTFFFFTQEFNRISMRQSAVNTTVPPLEFKRGDFSGLGAGRDGIFGTTDDPVVDPLSNAGFPGGIIPSNRIDANAVKLLNLYPDPNFKGPGTINYTSAAPSIQNWREEVIRIDQNFSTSWKVYGRYVQDSTFVRNPYGGSGTGGNYTPWPGIAGTQSDRPGKNFVANATKVIGPRLVNQANFAYSRRYFDMFSTSTLAGRTTLGITIPELFPENKGNIIPAIQLTGYATLNVRGTGHKELSTFELSDNLSKIAGRHILKTGAYYFYAGNYEQKFGPQTNGGFQFTTGFSKNSVANMLLGLPYGYSEVEKTVWTDARFASIEAFLQDDFKATSRLTLNLGLRYVTYFSPYDRGNVLSNFVPAAWNPAQAPRVDPSTGVLAPNTGDPLNGIVVAGKNSPHGRKLTENNANLLGPRFGFAWAPFRDKKTSVRGGYGIFHTRPMLGTFLDTGLSNPPFSRSVSLLNPLLLNPGAGVEPASAPPSLIAVSLPMLAPSVQQWSFGVQREVFPRAVLGVNYVGTHATHLMRPVNINAPEAGVAGASPGNRVNALRPYLGYGSISYRESSGSSVYHSMQVSFNRRVSGKLTVGVAYTWGKSIDDGSSERADGDLPPNKRNIRAERGPSDFDRTQIFTANFIWHLPRLARGPLAQPVLRGALDGWQLSGITRMWSGQPLDVTMSYDVAGIGGTQNQRPDVIADAKGTRTPEAWFNREAFARPANGTFGNLGRNALRGPGVNKWDLALLKNFRVREGKNLQFRGEMFNAFNHPSFTTVGRTLNTTATGVNPLASNFAVVTDTRDARVVQFALKLTF
jgi:opacity protein-like surface antigen